MKYLFAIVFVVWFFPWASAQIDQDRLEQLQVEYLELEREQQPLLDSLQETAFGLSPTTLVTMKSIFPVSDFARSTEALYRRASAMLFFVGTEGIGGPGGYVEYLEDELRYENLLRLEGGLRSRLHLFRAVLDYPEQVTGLALISQLENIRIWQYLERPAIISEETVFEVFLRRR